jgi:hypothetical protein
MHELVVNLHIHSVYSDETPPTTNSYHRFAAGIDVVIVSTTISGKGANHTQEWATNYAVWTEKKCTTDLSAFSPKGHLWVFMPGRNSPYGSHPRRLINRFLAGGMSFIAHPFESASPNSRGCVFGGDWMVRGFTAWKTLDS